VRASTFVVLDPRLIDRQLLLIDFRLLEIPCSVTYSSSCISAKDHNIKYHVWSYFRTIHRPMMENKDQHYCCFAEMPVLVDLDA
jgi:hypothetical protein